MSWSFNPKTMSTDDGEGIVPRGKLEEAAEVLHEAGICNRLLIVDVLEALSGLSKGEVKFNVDLALEERNEQWLNHLSKVSKSGRSLSLCGRRKEDAL